MVFIVLGSVREGLYIFIFILFRLKVYKIIDIIVFI